MPFYFCYFLLPSLLCCLLLMPSYCCYFLWLLFCLLLMHFYCCCFLRPSLLCCLLLMPFYCCYSLRPSLLCCFRWMPFYCCSSFRPPYSAASSECLRLLSFPTALPTLLPHTPSVLHTVHNSFCVNSVWPNLSKVLNYKWTCSSMNMTRLSPVYARPAFFLFCFNICTNDIN